MFGKLFLLCCWDLGWFHFHIQGLTKISNFGFSTQFCGIKWKIILFLHKRKTVNFSRDFWSFFIHTHSIRFGKFSLKFTKLLSKLFSGLRGAEKMDEAEDYEAPGSNPGKEL